MKLIDWVTGKVKTIKGWLFGGLSSEQEQKLKLELDKASQEDAAVDSAPSAAVETEAPSSGEEIVGDDSYADMCQTVKKLLDANCFLEKSVLEHVVKKSYSESRKTFDSDLFDRALQNRSRGYAKVPPQACRPDRDNRINDSVYYSAKWLSELNGQDVVRCIKEQIAGEIRQLRERYGKELNDPYRLQRILHVECDGFYKVVSNENYADLMLIDLGEPAFDDLSIEI